MHTALHRKMLYFLSIIFLELEYEMEFIVKLYWTWQGRKL